MTPPGTIPKVALILSGGGARAAYQVGVLRLLAEDLPADSAIPFRIVCGNSAGALNAAYLASEARWFGRAVRSLEQLWANLTPDAIYRTETLVLIRAATRMVRAFFRGVPQAGGESPALLDSGPLARLLERTVRLEGVAGNIDAGLLDALAITAFSYSSARSVSFCQTTPDQPMWARAQRLGVADGITVSHLLASAAIPFVFPSVRIGDEYYGDGSMRQVAPTSPALHLGAERILVVGVTRSSSEQRVHAEPDRPPSLAAIGGQLLANVFTDGMASDLEKVWLVNTAVRQIPGDARAASPVPLREVGLLTLNPSVSLESVAKDHLERLPAAIRRAIGRNGGAGIASYLLFHQDFCRALIDLGYRDARERRDELRAFLTAVRPA